MEAVDPVSDFLLTRGTVQAATLAFYISGKPPERDTWSDPPTKIRGSHGSRRVESTGPIKVERMRWTITSLTADIQLARPPMLSKIAAQGETWRIDTITASPHDGRLFICECTKVEK